jgi:hypothetical protein
MQRQGLQEQSVDDAEDGCIRSDSKRQSQNCDRREPRAAPQHPHGILQIVK